MSLNPTDPSAEPARAVSMNNERIRVGSVEELNDRFVSASSRPTLVVGSRSVRRDGQLFGLGGLDWLLTDGRQVVTLTTAEDELLPDLPVVRAAWPVTKSIVAPARGEVAA